MRSVTPPTLAVEQVGGDDLVVVVRGVGEGAAAVAVSQGPHPRGAGPQLVIHLHVALLVDGNARPVEPQVVGIGPASDREQDVAAHDRGGTARALEAHRHTVLVPRQRDAGRAGAHRHALPFEQLPDRLRDVLVLARNQPWRSLDHRHPAPEAAVHLRELQADVAPAHDHEVLGQGVELHHSGVREVGKFGEAGQVGDGRPATHIDEDPLGLQHLVAHAHASRALETGVALENGGVCEATQPARHPLARPRDDRVLAGLHRPGVHRYGPLDHHSPARGLARHESRAGAGHERLRGDAADVHAGSAEELPLDDRHLSARPAESRRQRGSGLAGADHDRVEVRGHGGL